jgi:hypothetical protein
MSAGLEHKPKEIRLTELPVISTTWDRCNDFLKIFAEKFSEKMGVFDSKQS